MINVSFFLLNPSAKAPTPLYVSVSTKGDKASRKQFATGEYFHPKYCNVGRGKGKELLKRNTAVFLQYNRAVSNIAETLWQIESDIRYTTGKSPAPEVVRDEYWAAIGRIKSNVKDSFFEVFAQYMEANKLQWSPGFVKVQEALVRHLRKFEKAAGYFLDLRTFDASTWQRITEYFIEGGHCNANTNKYLKYIKQFLRFAGKAGHFSGVSQLREWKLLDKVETFKIALKEAEVEAWANLDLSKHPRLDRVRDLFLLGILTGQRYSDIGKLLDKRNHYDGYIRICQQKTGEPVQIPIHPKLGLHLGRLFDKYRGEFPDESSNQKFNEYLKEIGQMIGESFNTVHQWTRLVGKVKTHKNAERYNLITTHTARRTFATLALKSGIPAEIIMKVTGHKKYEQFAEYVKCDDDDVRQAFAEKF